MTQTSFDKQKFWDDKILNWEKTRYQGETANQPFLEKLVRKGGGSIQFRMEWAAEILRPLVDGKVIFDAGSGSGYLFKLLSDTNARKFIGMDLAESAVECGKQLAEEFGYADRAEFYTGNICTGTLPEADIVVALGVLDWLSLEEIDLFLSKIESKKFLFVFSEKRFNLEQLLHKAYVWIAYGRRTEGYIPKYYSVADIMPVFQKHGFGNFKVLRHPRLSFGMVIHNLELGA